MYIWATDYTILCPVKVGAMVVKGVRSIQGVSKNTKVCSYVTEHKSITHINSSQVLSRRRAIGNIMDEATLEFKESNIGLPSIGLGGTMTMSLLGVSTIIVGRLD